MQSHAEAKRSRVDVSSVEVQSMELLDLVRSELVQRCDKNPSYSLRAFAKSIGFSHAALSQILSGKRNFTEAAKQKVALSLGLSLRQSAALSKSKTVFKSRFSEVDLDIYETVSDWYYDAILELTKLKHFRGEMKWIAKSLSLNINQVAIAVHKLQSTGLLEIVDESKWIDTSNNNTNNHIGDVTSIALKKYQKDLLHKSKSAVDEIQRELRDHTSLTLTFSKKDMKKAKELIKKFRAEFSQMNSVSKKRKDDVYTLQVSFFPLSQTDKER